MFRDFGKLAGLNYDIKKSKAAFPVLPCEVRVGGGGGGGGGCLNGIQNNEVQILLGKLNTCIRMLLTHRHEV